MKKLHMSTIAALATAAISLLGTFSTTALAQRGGGGRDGERLVLRYQQAHYRGQTTLRLKREIRRQYPEINIRRLKLNSVRLVAKTKQGRGTAQLFIGDYSSRAKTVYGTPRDFPNGNGGFDRVNFQSPAPRRGAQGPWQMDLRGNFKVKKIVLFVSRGRQDRNETLQIRCESTDYRYQECYLNGDVRRVQVSRQLSDRRCVEGQNWGYEYDMIWVDQGCRAIFTATLQGRNGGGRRDDGRNGGGRNGGGRNGGGRIGIAL